jgi:hypothetical protein
MTAFSNMLRCTVGGAALQLEDHRYSERPIVRGGGRAGSVATLSGQGWLEAADHSALAAALRAAEDNFRVSGQTIQVYGPGNVLLHELSSASFVEGGPHIEFTIEPGLQDGYGARRVTFTATGETTVDPGSGEQPNVPERRIATGPDNLKAVTWSGQISSTDIQATFDQLRAKFSEQFKPSTHWVISYELRQSDTGTKGAFSLTATELVDDLPESPQGTAVSGRASFSRERDDQMRLTRTYEYDLVVVGDVDAVLDLIRPEGLILRESVSVGYYAQRSLRASFTTLAGGDGTALMNWQASFRFEPSDFTYDEHRYPNTTPVLVQRPQGLGRVAFSGSATGAGVFIPPPSRPSTLRLLEPPQINQVRVNAVEYRTDWQYVWAWDRELEPLMYMLARPAENLPESPLPESKPRHPPAVPPPQP